jgi:hypothetical protein
MQARVLPIALGAITIGCPHGMPSPARDSTCLAIAFGEWLPAMPTYLPAEGFRALPDFLLRHEVHKNLTGWTHMTWRRLGTAPLLGADSLRVTISPNSGRSFEWTGTAYLQGWRTNGDSLLLLAGPTLGDMLGVRGVWQADTLIARAHAFSDVIMPHSESRADAFGIRYHCADAPAAVGARAAVAARASAAIPDTTRARLEADFEQAYFANHLGRQHWFPIDW